MKQTATSLMSTDMENGSGTLIATRWNKEDIVDGLMEHAVQDQETAHFIFREFGIPMDKVKRVCMERGEEWTDEITSKQERLRK